jgi:hypothetical protein
MDELANIENNESKAPAKLIGKINLRSKTILPFSEISMGFRITIFLIIFFNFSLFY